IRFRRAIFPAFGTFRDTETYALPSGARRARIARNSPCRLSRVSMFATWLHTMGSNCPPGPSAGSGVIRLPAVVVGVEAEAASVIQDTAPEQPVLVEEAGGFADRPA